MDGLVKGALIYLPAGATLYDFDDEGVVEKYKTMLKPTNVLFIGNNKTGIGTLYDVLYEGSRWSVHKGDAYPTRRE